MVLNLLFSLSGDISSSCPMSYLNLSHSAQRRGRNQQRTTMFRPLEDRPGSRAHVGGKVRLRFVSVVTVLGSLYSPAHPFMALSKLVWRTYSRMENKVVRTAAPYKLSFFTASTLDVLSHCKF